MPAVTKIPATVRRFTETPVHESARRRVAAYARVSTDGEDQQNSYEAQCGYYESYIKSNSGWDFAGIYADEGKSGTGTKNRDGFNRMVEDALAGKIDLILTKSVSRFARNTVDSLTTIRKLKEKGVEVYFEKENIRTFDSKGELLLTIMSSLAQEESRSLSLNVKWGIRKKFADGAVSVPFSRFLGYDRGGNGELVVNREEAEVVKLIFSEFLEGRSYCAIARRLTERGIKTPSGLDVWSKTTVKSILRNEKYKGCALLQKKYTADYLTRKVTVNRGEVPQYYVEGSHEAIIDPETFDEVQEMMDRRGRIPGNCTADCVFSGKIRCGVCGGWYGRKVWHSNDKFRKVVWQCNEKYRGEGKCTSPHLSEDEIKGAFTRLAGMLAGNRDKVTAYMKKKEKLCGTEELEEELKVLDGRMDVQADGIQALIDRNARVSQNQEEYNTKYSELESEFERTRAEREKVAEEIKERKSRGRKIRRLMKTLGEMPGEIKEFDESLWSGLVDCMTVYAKDDIRFTLISGEEVKV